MASGPTVKSIILRVVQPAEPTGQLRSIGSAYVSGEYITSELVPNLCPSCNGRCLARGIGGRGTLCQRLNASREDFIGNRLLVWTRLYQFGLLVSGWYLSLSL